MPLTDVSVHHPEVSWLKHIEGLEPNAWTLRNFFKRLRKFVCCRMTIAMTRIVESFPQIVIDSLPILCDVVIFGAGELSR